MANNRVRREADYLGELLNAVKQYQSIVKDMKNENVKVVMEKKTFDKEIEMAKQIDKELARINKQFKRRDLTENEREILIESEEKLYKLSRRVYYAVLGKMVGDATLDEIGKIFSITRERVRQIENSAIKKLRHPRSGRKLAEYRQIGDSLSDHYYSVV